MTGLFYVINALIAFFSVFYGRTLIEKDFNSLRGRDITGGDINLTFVNMINLVSSIINILVCFQSIQLALAATSDYFNLYERKPEFDLSCSSEKPKISEIKGKIEFNNVSFYYPSDLSKKLILNGINLNFESGKKLQYWEEQDVGRQQLVI